jgi:NAD(P)-dependent dehydrogenase (short-subunit alcohol dehydrogenase family)
MRSLLNKHAIITGGSRGIGLAIAQRFASEGASVTLVGRDASRLQAALNSLPQSTQAEGPQAQHAFRAFDVSRFDQWTAMVNDMKKVRNVSRLVQRSVQYLVLYGQDPSPAL